MIKILHTADWHIGKMLQKHSLEEDHRMFLDWLYDFLVHADIDVLLISGDVFDFANPSNGDRLLYYSFLRKLIQLNITVVITGGNHDSVSMLEAPKPILNALGIHVIGGTTDDPVDEIIELKDREGHIICCLLAVPFLRDKDVRRALTGETYAEKVDEVRAGILSHYEQLIEIVKNKYNSTLPVIAMGHLYLQGASLSDSERDIQLGNQAGISVSAIPASIDYFALGHIHRPQSLRKDGMIRYSGSPICLSFSERKDNKQVILITVNENIIEVEPIGLPKFRSLKKMKGNLAEVGHQLLDYDHNDPLASLIELEVIEEDYDPFKIRELQDMVSRFTLDKAVIVKHHIRFLNAQEDIHQLYMEGQQVEDLKPREVFEKRLESLQLEPEKNKMLLEAFSEIYEEVNKT